MKTRLTVEQKTLSVVSSKSDEYTTPESLPVLQKIEIICSPPEDDLPIDKLQILREQLIRKNRLLADLKRQLLGAQNMLTQLYCMVDSQVSTTMHMREQVADTQISLVECAISATQELDSSSNRMSYLIKQLQNAPLSTKR